MAEGDVFAIEAKEYQGQHKDDQERRTEEDDYEEEVWLLGIALLDFHMN